MPPTQPALGGRLALDVSNVNPITVTLARQAGCSVLIAKATEGSNYRDTMLAAHRSVARELGLRFGVYLFLHAHSPGNEAAEFLAWAKPRRDEFVVIDAEPDGQDGATIPEMARRANACAAALEHRGHRPILYASSSYWLPLVTAAPTLKRLRVWEAQYPGRFTRWLPRLARLRIRLKHCATVVMWQWTDSYEVGGHHYDASRLFVDPHSL